MSNFKIASPVKYTRRSSPTNSEAYFNSLSEFSHTFVPSDRQTKNSPPLGMFNLCISLSVACAVFLYCNVLC